MAIVINYGEESRASPDPVELKCTRQTPSCCRCTAIELHLSICSGYGRRRPRRGFVCGRVCRENGPNLQRLLLNTHTYTELIMATKTISITEEAYERLRSLKNNEKASFSDVIVKYYPVKRKLSDVLAELGDCTELADNIEKVSREMRKGKMREVRF